MPKINELELQYIVPYLGLKKKERKKIKIE
jgi:hypothetical protein